MAKQISATEIRRHFSKYLHKVEHGQEFLITVRGIPVAILTPVTSKEIKKSRK